MLWALVVIIALAGAVSGIAFEGLLDKQLGIAAILNQYGVTNYSSVIEEVLSSVLGAVLGAIFASLMAFVGYRLFLSLSR
jgi:hypothetical protein